MKQIKYFLGYLHTKRVHFLFSVGMQICQHTTTRRGTWGRWAVSTRQIKHTQVNCWAVEDTIQARDEPARGRALMLTRDLSQVRFFHMVRVQKGSQYILGQFNWIGPNLWAIWAKICQRFRLVQFPSAGIFYPRVDGYGQYACVPVPAYPMGKKFCPITYPRVENLFHTRLLIR